MVGLVHMRKVEVWGQIFFLDKMTALIDLVYLVYSVDLVCLVCHDARKVEGEKEKTARNVEREKSEKSFISCFS